MSNGIQNKLKDSLYDSMRAVLDHLDMHDVSVVFANESGLEPRNTYCAIRILERKRVGRVQESTASPRNSVSENVYTNYYTLYTQISFIGENSDDIMADFEDSVFGSRQCIEFWQMRNLGPLSQSPSRYIPQLRETKWIPVYNIDLKLSYSVQSKESIDWIDSFTVEDAYGFEPWPSP